MQSEKTVAKKDDEQQIRQMVDTWLEASKAHDLPTLLNLLDDDVLFVTPGKEPFGKEAFASGNEQLPDMEATIDIREIEVVGDWAWMRSFLRVSFMQPGKDPVRHSGHILTILRKRPDGQWVIKRDANFVKPE